MGVDMTASKITQRFPAVVLLAFALGPTSSHAASAKEPPDLAQQLLAQLCTQSGLWRGAIDIVSADGKTERPLLESSHECTRQGGFSLDRERFITNGTIKVETIKVTYLDTKSGDIVVQYFADGHRSEHRYRAIEVVSKDRRHWSTTLESTSAGDLFDGRPATMRYIRSRIGNKIESRKEVRFNTPEAKFVTRSTIIQTLVSDRQ